MVEMLVMVAMTSEVDFGPVEDIGVSVVKVG